jgi:hypothetical protein
MCKTAAEFRREAAICEEIARRLSIKEERDVLLQTAQRLLQIAERIEAGELPDVLPHESSRDPPSG